MFSKKQKVIGGGIATALALAAAGALAVFMLMPHDAPAQVTLEDAVAQLASPSAGTTPAPAGTSMIGTWTVTAGGDSFVGYRVKEQLATLGDFTAVGRTKQVNGTLTFDGTAITDVQITVDMTSLQSDDSRRDGALRRQALETEKFPTASFKLTRPILLNRVPAEGQTITATATGDLTLHGVTKPVALELQGQLAGGRVVVAGSTTIRFADYTISPPKAPIVLGVEDTGVLELQLAFDKSTGA